VEYKGFASLTHGGKNGGFIFHAPHEENGDVLLEVAYSGTVQELDTRLVAIDKKGNIKIATAESIGKVQDLTSARYRVKDIKTSDIDHFEFQSRPYETTTFENVVLKSGEK
jgi:hypothetical protein